MQLQQDDVKNMWVCVLWLSLVLEWSGSNMRSLTGHESVLVCVCEKKTLSELLNHI